MSEETIPTHVKTVVGARGTHSRAVPNPDNPGNPFAAGTAFKHLDGDRVFAEWWSRLPAPFDGDYRLTEVMRDGGPGEYLQVGGRRGRMTFEMRRLVDGRFRQYVIGRKADFDRAVFEYAPEEEVPIQSNVQEVYPHEVWTSASVTPVFRLWFEEGEIPGGLTIREL
ncbi:hypothetical protein JD292_11115 [Leucobacter sp. CSA2]|uniref:Uncharacterized protein n=1 Tax=Leucobacter edaphi TaxID=2796472 RepID=A0A934QDG4_9MICO|nr:hypothetical protein [Leucobacter edaphi]MBK0422621.1 hypothetical protein [Leucobacter edaphi]